jgi:two-component system, cell cycle response regulator CpdR
MTAPIRILYVEDNELVREVTCELLGGGGRQVVAVGTAEEALREFKRSPFDLVITDISLPAMSGMDLARSILGIDPAMRIIVASGYAVESIPQKLGPNVRTIAKPFEGPQIDALIADLCP